jgi:two-component system response regulator FixJ
LSTEAPTDLSAIADRSTVYVIDDDTGTRQFVALLGKSIGLEVKTFQSPLDFLDTYDGRRPGCILLDLIMPGIGGLEAQQRFAQAKIDLPVILLSGYGDIASVVRGMKAGAVEFLEKPVSRQVLLEQVQKCLAQDADRARAAAATKDLRHRFTSLSRREKQVLENIVEGRSSREIGDLLGISVKTVSIHRSNLLKKTGARSTGQLIGMTIAARPDAMRPARGALTYSGL